MKRERERELSYTKERDSFIVLLERGMDGSSITHPSGTRTHQVLASPNLLTGPARHIYPVFIIWIAVVQAS